MNLTSEQIRLHQSRVERGAVWMVRSSSGWLAFSIGSKSSSWVATPWDATGYGEDTAKLVAKIFRNEASHVEVVRFAGV